MNFLCGLLLLLASNFSDFRVTSEDSNGHFLNSWAAEIVGGADVARQVAEQHGYRIVRSLDHIEDHYELERSDTPHRSRRSAEHHTRKLSEDDRVLYVEQQQHKTRVKREYTQQNDYPDVQSRDSVANDPEFKHQWYLVQEDKSEIRREKENTDLRVLPVWKRNVTGKGAVVTVVDDGLERTHSDLKRNYDAAASYDFNQNDEDPSPRYEKTNENKHGTRCAGEIAMTANNEICGTGIAYNAGVGGLKILDGPVTDIMESRALSFNRDYIHIYTSSWGPSDDGKTCEAPGKLTKVSLENGAKLGRKGKGSIFIVASGNGGPSGDNCNCDGYTSSIFTISVSSASQNGQMPYYAERCSSTLTSAFSSGSYSEDKVISTDLHDKCTDSHSGTSAAAPMVAGIAALIQEVNPDLTWRDFQHILIHGSSMRSLEDNNGWYKNGVGYCVNLAFGFGLIDADAVTTLADPKTWKPVDEQRICKVEPTTSSGFPQKFKSGETVEVEFVTDGCAGQANEIHSLEHVVVNVNIAHERRGNVFVEMQSPSGTITVLMLERRNDASTAGFTSWGLTSVHNWGEEPAGIWTLRVADRSNDNYKGSLNNATLILYGTKDKPEHQKDMPKLCDHLKPYADSLTNVIAENRNSGRTSFMSSLKQPYLPKTAQTSDQKTSPPGKTEDLHKSSVGFFKELLQSLSHG